MAKKFKHLFGKDKGIKNLMLFVIGFALIGSVILIVSHAASPPINVEPENGNITSPAQSGSDSSASNGSFVQFGSTNRSRLGIDKNFLPSGISLQEAYRTIASTGFGWVRTGPDMSNYLSPTLSDVASFDREIGYAKANNLKIMAVMTYSSESDCQYGHCAPSDPAAWAHLAGLYVAHWKVANPGVVQAVEVWNEANNDQFWSPVNPSKYTDLLKRTYMEIKAADPFHT